MASRYMKILALAGIAFLSHTNLLFAAPAAKTPVPVATTSKITLNDLLGGSTASTAVKTTPVKPQSKTMAVASMSAADSGSAASASGAQNFAKTLSVDPRSGSAAVSIPLYIPQGRGGMAPAIGLVYAPTNGNGPFGWGWGMDMGSVVRSTKNGTPNYNATDTFLVSLGGKNFELVSLGTNNEYRSKFDDDRVRFFFSNNVWSAKDKSGTTYYFGSRVGSNVTDGGTKVFRWKLDRIVDLFGNVLVTDYAADGSFEVRYGLKVGKSTTADVNDKTNFAYVINATVQATDRSDIFTDYKPGFAVSEKRLIATLTVTGGGNLLRKYNFTYVTSAKTGRSILKNVTEVGADGVMTQPVINVQYNDAVMPTYSVSSVGDPLQGDNLWKIMAQHIEASGTLNVYGYPKVSTSLDSQEPFISQSGSFLWETGTWTFNNANGEDMRINHTAGKVNKTLFCADPSVNSICSPEMGQIYATSDPVWVSTYVYLSQAKDIPMNFDVTSGCAGNDRCLQDSFVGIYVNDVYVGRYCPFYQEFPTIHLSAGFNYVKFALTNSFKYQSSVVLKNFRSQVDYMNSSQVILPQLAGDFNGDGKSDVATYFSDTGTMKIAISNGSGFLPKAAWITGFAQNQRLILGDFNGDGRADIAAHDVAAGTVRVAISDGTKFTDSGVWLSGITSGASVLTGDFNGGGLTDLYVMTLDASGWLFQVAKSSGSGFAKGATYRPHVGTTSAMTIPADVNGDGMTDLVGLDRTAGTWSVHLNTSGFNEKEFYSTTDFGANMTPVVSDFNQDGRADAGYFDAANKKIVYLPSISGGFGAEKSLAFNFTLTDPTVTQVQAADFNADGVMDFMAFDNQGKSDMVVSSGTKFQDLVTSYDNGFGGVMTLNYASSSDYSNNYLPFAVPVVQSVSASNSLVDTFTTSYNYSGAYWNPTEREMYGFKEVRVIDADGNYALSQFNQTSLYLRGRLDRTAMYSTDGKLYQETKYQWNNDLVITGRTDVRFVSPKRIDNFVYDVTAATPMGVRTAVESTYNISLGVPTEVRDYGEVDWTTGADTNTDYIRTALTYGSNTTNNVQGLVTSKISYDKNSVILSKNYSYYDSSTVLGTITKGLATKSTVWNKVGTVEALLATTNTFNAYGQLLTTKNPLNQTTSVTYDTTWSMFPLKKTNAKGFVATMTYYGVNFVKLTGGVWGLGKTVTDANSQVASTTYDALGRVVSEVNPLDSATYPTTTYEYQTKANYRVLVTHRRVEHGQAATFDSYAYIDGLGRGIVSKYLSETAGQYIVAGHASYNSRGLADKQYPPYFSTQGFDVLELPDRSRTGATIEYDAMGRKVKVTYSDGTYASYSYSPTVGTVIDPNGHKSVSVSDARGRIMQVQEWSGADGRSPVYPAQAFILYASTAYAYDILGNLLSVVDAKGNVTIMTYDALGRKLTMNDPDMHNVSYEYDALGQLAKQTDAKSVPFAFTYDAIGRTLTKARADNIADLVTYTYDTGLSYGKGRLAQVNYASGSATFNYDAIGEEIMSSKTIGTATYNVVRNYDALGRLTMLGYPDWSNVLYSYDAAGSLNAIQLQTKSAGVQDVITNIDHTADGRTTRIDYGNGAVAFYSYDALSLRLKNQRVVDKNGAVVQEYDYSYDSVGNITRVDDKVKIKAKAYSYDELGRMISSNDGTGEIVYAYDQIGNIVKKGDLLYTYGENGAGPHAATGISDGTVMSYDAVGNMAGLLTSDKAQYFSYDSSNRLIKVEQKLAGEAIRSDLAEYSYDGDGGRTRKVVYRKESDGSVTPVETRYVGELYEESEGSKIDHIFLGSSRVATYSNGKLRWLVGDHLGSTNVVLDEASSLIERTDYTPWGEVAAHEMYGDSSEVAWFYFTGKKVDDETGLVFFGARYYAPKLGRFITADTIVQSPYNPQTLNRYTYCNNNPINLVDPAGHSWGKFIASAIGAVVGVALSIVSGGALAPLIGAFWAGVVGGALGGAVGGAITGGMLGGTEGALQGAMYGAAFGAVGGGVASFGKFWGGAMLATSGGYAAATENLDMFAGALAGGYVGTQVASGIQSYNNDGIAYNSGRKADPYANEDWTLLGIGTDSGEAARYALANDTTVFYTPSRGIIADFTRAGMQKIFGNSLASRQMAGYLKGTNRFTIHAHSEGTLTLAGAIRSAAGAGVRLPDTRFDFNGPGITQTTANHLGSMIGAKATPTFHLNPADPIGMIATWNPVTAPIYGVLGIATLTHFHDTTTYTSFGGGQ